MFKYQRKNNKAKLSIAPLLDMIFILLIFFVVSTTFSKLPGIKVDRPEATMPDLLSSNNILIGISKEGDFYINKEKKSIDQIDKKLKLRFESNDTISVLIVADKASILQHTITIMDLCRRIGIENVSVAEEIIQ